MLIEKDVHSYYQNGQPKITHINWGVTVTFATRVLECVAEITFNDSGPVSLDTRDLKIVRVYEKNGALRDIPFELGESDPILGSKLNFVVPDDPTVVIAYYTSPTASGLQWGMAEETHDKEHPFLYCQGEPIHTRSYLPCQDTPGIRFTYNLTLCVPKELRGLACAPNIGNNRVENKTNAFEEWQMPFPIPSYLVAFIVGDFQSHQLSENPPIYVWAEPSLVTRAAEEFEDLPEIFSEAEALFGVYPWDTYGVMVMPTSFPYGGMENPCLTFVTPALLAGDKSGVSTLVHELAHSWTGNLVTNATWRDFSLNEGWTVLAQYLINRAHSGEDFASLDLRLLQLEFERDLKHFEAVHPLLSSLAPDLTGRHPDDSFSRVPYFKGAMLLLRIRESVQPFLFREFIRGYIQRFRFESITTARFLEFLNESFPRIIEHLRVWEWVYEAGMPDNAIKISSLSIVQVEEVVASRQIPTPEMGWSSLQKILYLGLVSRPCAEDHLRVLDERFQMSTDPNIEVRWAFLLLAVESGYTAVFGEVEKLLRSYGRMKYVVSLYKALAQTPEGRELAERVLAEVRSGYHPITTAQAERVLREASPS